MIRGSAAQVSQSEAQQDGGEGMVGAGQGGTRENGEDKLVWEFENCGNGRNILSFDLESWRASVKVTSNLFELIAIICAYSVLIF